MSLSIASAEFATTTPKPVHTTPRTGRKSPVQPPLRNYDRARDLPHLLPLWPSEIADQSLQGRERIIQRMRRALRQERCRGLAGHWTYDLARHSALLRAYKHELALLDRSVEPQMCRRPPCSAARSVATIADTPA